MWKFGILHCYDGADESYGAVKVSLSNHPRIIQRIW